MLKMEDREQRELPLLSVGLQAPTNLVHISLWWKAPGKADCSAFFLGHSPKADFPHNDGNSAVFTRTLLQRRL